MDNVTCFIGGIFLGCVFGYAWRLLTSGRGILHIDTHNDEKDLYKFELFTPLEKLPMKKWMILRVNPDADLSPRK